MSETALPMACLLAQKYGSRIFLLRALEPSSSLKYITHPDALQLLQRVTESLRLEAERYLEEQQQTLRQQGYNVAILLAEGAAAESIIDAAMKKEVDLIVMSTHGRGGLARWTVGSVADKVARHSPCPVLLVRHGLSEPGQSQERR